MKLAARVDFPPKLAQQLLVAIDQVEDESLEVGRFGDVHRRAAGRVGLSAAAYPIAAGAKKFVEDVILIGTRINLERQSLCFRPSRQNVSMPRDCD